MPPVSAAPTDTLAETPALTLESSVASAVWRARELNEQLNAARDVLTQRLAAVLMRLVQPGTVLKPYQGPFGRMSVVKGTARGASQFEVAGPAQLVQLNIVHPHLSQFEVLAYPLNDAGKPMSGRAGNSRTSKGNALTLRVGLAADGGPDETRSSLELLLETVRAAAPVEAGLESGAAP